APRGWDKPGKGTAEQATKQQTAVGSSLQSESEEEEEEILLPPASVGLAALTM
ncbi:Hypothetical predicted protein, partial [Pelobates cultripes]